MLNCDVLIVGGGPAGSSCAWKLRQAGLDVLVVDAAPFPRDKVCAGWITPPVLEELQIDPSEYHRGRTFQVITGFRIGLIGAEPEVAIRYDRPISFGIRRCEFDEYLLRRSGARLQLDTRVTCIRRQHGRLVVNERFSAPALVGAGGHFCPVARWLNGSVRDRSVVMAQEAELEVDCRQVDGRQGEPFRSPDAETFTTAADLPGLYFDRDLEGYGWCFRKQQYVNLGFGRLGRRVPLPHAMDRFLAFLRRRQKIPVNPAWRWRGHAYLLSRGMRPFEIDDGIMLVGDAVGLAYAQSGEGIRPAVESGLLAAATLIEAGGSYTRERLEPYRDRIRARFGVGAFSRALARGVPPSLTAALGSRLLARPWFVRHLVLDRWFLHANEPSLEPV
jgi:menaquinone-9 beta-reductase